MKYKEIWKPTLQDNKRGKHLKDNVIYFKLFLKDTVNILLVIFYIQTHS